MAGYFIHREYCPACGEPDRERLLERPYDSGELHEYLTRFYQEKGIYEPDYLRGESYKIVECASCKLIYQEDIPNQELLERIYGLWVDPAAAFDRNVNKLGGNIRQYLEEMWLLKYRGEGRQLRVLDFGMGWGRWCEVARNFGHLTSGFDFESNRQDRARPEGIEVVDYEDIPSKEYDFINTEQVFEHLSAPLETLRSLVSGLRNGGLIRLSVPNGRLTRDNLTSGRPLNFTKGHRQGLAPIVPLLHLNCWTNKSLQRFAAQAGLRRYRFPLLEIIASKQDWMFPKKFALNVLRPVYARLRYDDGTSLYFEKQL